MNEENQNIQIPEVEDTAGQETEKLSPITEEMLENFSPKKKEPKVEEENDQQENLDAEPEADNTDEEEEQDSEKKKTVVDFSENAKQDTDDKQDSNKKTKKSSNLIKIIVITLIIIIFSFLIFGIWNRWFRYDDQKDIISNWQISGTDKTVAIDKDTITINPNAVLNYKLDTFSKVITYEIGDMKGSSHYRFSWDRTQLAIVESCSTDPMSTIFSDLGYFWDWSTCNMSNIELSPAYTKNNKQEVDTDNTGLEDIMKNGQGKSILLDKISTKKPEDN